MLKSATLILAIVSSAASTTLIAQSAPLTLPQAVQLSLEKYPAVRVSAEQAAAAAESINLARKGYWPRLDVLAQFNRATRNNVFGLLLPQSVIPSMSGPVLGVNDSASVWGSAVGVLVSWEPFDFGLRRANVASATSTERRAEATVVRSRLDVAAAAADAFLTLLAAQETLRAAQRRRRAGAHREGVVGRPREGRVCGPAPRRARARRGRPQRKPGDTGASAPWRMPESRWANWWASRRRPWPCARARSLGCRRSPRWPRRRPRTTRWRRNRALRVEEARAARTWSRTPSCHASTSRPPPTLAERARRPMGPRRAASRACARTCRTGRVGLTVTFPLFDLPPSACAA